MILAGPPVGEVPVPAPVTALAAGRIVRAVWRNEAGGLTFEVGETECFVKWAPAGSGLDLPAEADRLRWARRFTPVATVLDSGADTSGSWLVLSALPGRSAVEDRWRRQPAKAVAAIGVGLRSLHDALPIPSCPFAWDAAERVGAAIERVELRRTSPEQWALEHQHLTTEAVVQQLLLPPPVDRLVVCHGDACAPNTLLDDDGNCVAHVDLGALGIADRWADLAVATWSTVWNYGTGWERALLDAYGVEPDPERTAWYRLLWDLT